MTDKPLVSDLQLDEAHKRLTASGALKHIVAELRDIREQLNESIAYCTQVPKLDALIELGSASIEGTEVQVYPFELPFTGEFRMLDDDSQEMRRAVLGGNVTVSEIGLGRVPPRGEYARTVPTAEGGEMVGLWAARRVTGSGEDPLLSANPEFTEFLETLTQADIDAIRLSVRTQCGVQGYPRSISDGELSEAELAEGVERWMETVQTRTQGNVHVVITGGVNDPGGHVIEPVGDLTVGDLTLLANSRKVSPAVDEVIENLKAGFINKVNDNDA